MKNSLNNYFTISSSERYAAVLAFFFQSSMVRKRDQDLWKTKTKIALRSGSEHVAEKLNFITKQSRKMMTGQFAPFAEDMAMDSIVKALKHVENFKGSEVQFKAWLKQIVKNTCTDFLRRKKTVRTTDGDIVAFSDKKSKVFTENDTSKVDSEKACLKQALKNLDNKTKEILFLKHYYNCSGREISSYLGIKELHVSVYHARALKALKHKMAKLTA